MIRLLNAIIIFSLMSCYSEKGDIDYRVAFKNDTEGNTLQGSKETLINAIRGGADVKIGWGWKGETHSIEHLSEPIWIAILDELEVIAHLDPQVLSKTDWNKLTADYADSTLLYQEWRVVLSTQGTFDAVWYDRKNNKLTKRMPQNHTMTWFVKGAQKESSPLYMEK